MRVATFIEQSHTVDSIEVLVGMFCDVLNEYGFTHYCCYSVEGLLIDTDKPVGQAQRLHYHPGFLKEYQEKRHMTLDPLFKILCLARGPFNWKQVMDLPLKPKQKSIMQARFDAGMYNGVGIPLQSADPALVGISIWSDEASAPADIKTLSQLFAACNQFQLQRARILGTEQAFVLPEVHLTPREREMLEWAAQGKSNSVIGSILGISEKTVEFHFKSIFTKLDVSSRTTAVLKAVHMRLITLDEWL